MAAIKEGGVTQNESLLPKFLHKKKMANDNHLSPLHVIM